MMRLSLRTVFQRLIVHVNCGVGKSLMRKSARRRLTTATVGNGHSRPAWRQPHLSVLRDRLQPRLLTFIVSQLLCNPTHR